MAGDERRECKGERRETIEGGFKARQGLRRCFFPHHFPPVSPFWVGHSTTSTSTCRVQRYPLPCSHLPQPLTLNPAVLLVHPFQSSPVYLPQTPHLDHRLSDKPYTSQFRVYAELCSFRDPSHQIPASALERYL